MTKPVTEKVVVQKPATGVRKVTKSTPRKARPEPPLIVASRTTSPQVPDPSQTDRLPPKP